MLLLPFSWKNFFFRLISNCFLSNVRKSGSTSREKFFLPTDISARQLNSGEHLLQTITVKIPTRKLESAKRKQQIRRIRIGILANSSSARFSLKNLPPGDFLPYGKFSHGKSLKQKICLPRPKNACIFPNNKYYK